MVFNVVGIKFVRRTLGALGGRVLSSVVWR